MARSIHRASFNLAIGSVFAAAFALMALGY